MLYSRYAFVVVAAISRVRGHGYISSFIADGKTYQGYNPTIYPWVPVQDSPSWANQATDTGFVPSSRLQSTDIICHLTAQNAPKSATVTAGGTILIQWTPWPESHHGPIIDYLARCDGPCEKVDKSTLEFFKIAEVGQLQLGPGGGRTGVWADDQLKAAGMTWNTTIPSELAPGNYVLRHEILALHSAYNEGDAQFYPQCINLQVTGSGTWKPQGVLGTHLYKSDDAGVLYNIYNDETKPQYRIPGPPIASL
ncbi:glycoside hydrolase [Microdochium bolleyi]|uniref:lytic cellulose monooxygenase (C4-dehydrogenating) n=1 Tax=Microdochium bolleyi TaxID=196109 RepID=A0A136JG85_9PEZI|nr:glycoside hydrolase [Microdochium bolleyi]